MIPKFNRIIIIIMDSVGCGSQKDYKKYHPQKSNTLLSVYKSTKNFHLPILESLGLSKILFNKTPAKNYCAGKIKIKTAGNDTLASVWEMLGIVFKHRYRSTKKGLSKRTIQKIERELQTPIIGNEYTSSRKAFEKYYPEHKNTGFPIIYLADDGVILLSAHEKIISPRKLNFLGEKLAQILDGEKIIRVIVRTFVGKPGKLIRRRQDTHYPITNNMSLIPIIYYLKKNKIKLTTTQHIYSILGKPLNTNLTKPYKNNHELIKIIKNKITTDKKRQVMLFCLTDFDKLGHKKDAVGYGKKLKEFDKTIPKIIKAMDNKDLLIINADHGCDPNLDIRGHTREHVPLLVYYHKNKQKKWLKTRKTLADIGQTICYNFNLPKIKNGNKIREIL